MPEPAVIIDKCPYDCRLPVNLPNAFSGQQVRITIEVIEPVPNEVVEVVEVEEEPKKDAMPVKGKAKG